MKISVLFPVHSEFLKGMHVAKLHPPIFDVAEQESD